MNILATLALLIATAQFSDIPKSEAVVQVQDAKHAGEVAARLRKETQHLNWFSESDEPIDVFISKGMNIKGTKQEAVIWLNSQITMSLDADGQATRGTKKYRAILAELKQLKNLRGTVIDEGTARVTYVIGGDIGGYFIGIRVKATET